jgi:hypothetical protein
MRRLLAAAAATATALVLSAPPATSEATECTAASDTWCFFPAPADWEETASDFMSCPRCQSYGQQGITQGRWSAYHCEGRVQGIDYYYHLYIPPGG